MRWRRDMSGFGAAFSEVSSRMRVCQEPLGTFRGASAAMRRHRDGTRSPSQPDASCASRATQAAAKLSEALSGPTKAQHPQFSSWER